MPYSKKLSRHMARYLGSDRAEEELARVVSFLKERDPEGRFSAGAKALENFGTFLGVIDESYQNYEDNLEISERNITLSSAELVRANRSIRSMVNSLGQGFLVFDKTGICGPIYSKACESLLEKAPSGKHISVVLGLDEAQRRTMDSLLRLVFSDKHAMSFDEIMEFAPRAYAHSQGVHVQLAYKADAAENGRVDRIVLVATDVSEQVRAQEVAERRKAQFDALERILLDRQSFGTFIRRLYELTKVLDEQGYHVAWEALQREVHTLKGGAGLFRLNSLAGLLHDVETDIKPFLSQNPFAVPEKGDACFSVLHRHRDIVLGEIDEISTHLQTILGVDVAEIDEESNSNKRNLYSFADYLGQRGLMDIRQEYIRRICAQSLIAYLRRFDLVVGDLASRLNKKVRPIQFLGQDVPVVIDLYRNFFDSMVHVFRNIVDHGIERPDLRREEGKDPFGSITIRTELYDAAGRGLSLRMEIADDGAGMDVSLLRKKMASLCPNGNWSARSDREVLDNLLIQSVSSCDVASLYSGRGVGICSVNAEVAQLGGVMSLSSLEGKGTLVLIELPYLLETRADNR